MKFFRELRKRNFCKVGAVYIVAAWLAWQIFIIAIEQASLPDWATPAFKWTVLAAFPVVMAAAWLLELTPDGFRLQKNVDPSKSIARRTGRQLTRGIVVILAMALVLYLTDRFREQVWSKTDEPTPHAETQPPGHG